MAKTEAELVTEIQQLNAENRELRSSVENLRSSNRFKWFILLTAVGVGSFSLMTSIWSDQDEDRNGLSEAGIALSAISLGLSIFGLVKDSCCSRGNTVQGGVEEERADEERASQGLPLDIPSPLG